MVLKNKCATNLSTDEGKVTAPEGWKFQDCEEELITLVRTEEKGDWEVDYEGNKIPKDNYVSAFEYEDGKWESTSYIVGQGHSTVRIRGRSTALWEGFCVAKGMNKMKEASFDDRFDEYGKELYRCRARHGVRIVD